MAELACTTSATTAARAHLVLLGPRRGVDREDREHRVSERGAHVWWGMAAALRTETRSDRRTLLLQALSEWAVDDPGAVQDVLRRVAEEPHGREIWRQVLSSSPLWERGSQLVLARWVAEVDDQETALSACVAVGLQLSAGHEVVPMLVAAAVETAERVGVAVRYLPGAVGFPWRTTLTAYVVQACVAALDAGTTGEAAAEDAIRRLDAETLPLGYTEAALTAYGAMAYAPTNARPDIAAPYVPENVDVDALTSLLLAWLPSLKLRSEVSDLIEVPVTTAVLNLLVVLAARDPLPFLVRAEPARVQPLLSAHVLDGNDLTAMASLSLLAALRHVDLEPTDGPGLVDVVEASLSRDSLVVEAALDFVRTVRHVRGGSAAGALLDRVAATRNESIAQGLAELAVAYLRSPTCPPADEREIRSALTASLESDGWRHAVRLEGIGSAEDPVVMAIGPDRRTEVRRLLRGQ